MFTTITRRRSRVATAALGVVAAVSLAFAPAASAAAGQNSSSGLNCTGVVVCGPFAASAFPGGRPVSTLVSASAGTPELVRTRAIRTTANQSGASATVASLRVQLAPNTTVTTGVVTSSCTVNGTTGAITGTSSIANGQVNLPVLAAIQLDVAAAPNTMVAVPGVANITLNRQTTNPQDGTLTVDAIFISLLGSTQTITVATSVCGPRAMGIPVIAPAFAVGTVGAAAVGLPVLGFFLYRRRQTSADIARA